MAIPLPAAKTLTAYGHFWPDPSITWATSATSKSGVTDSFFILHLVNGIQKDDRWTPGALLMVSQRTCVILVVCKKSHVQASGSLFSFCGHLCGHEACCDSHVLLNFFGAHQ